MVSFPAQSSKPRPHQTISPPPLPLPSTTQGRALARLKAFDLDPAFDPPAPSGGRVEVFIWGSGAKRRAAKPHTSRGGRREADRRRCPQMDTGAREHRALARCRTLGASLFLLTFFWRLKKKVSRRKGETLSSRYRSNGYVHLQKKGRCQAAIASRLAPTGIEVHPQKTGRLSGRHRWQAGSQSGSRHIRKKQVHRQFRTMKPAAAPLPQRHTRLPSNQRKIVLAPPQVQGPDYRHSTNRKRPQTTENRPSCRQNLLWMNVPLTDLTGLPILMAT